jgi:hypothetical protein
MAHEHNLLGVRIPGSRVFRRGVKYRVIKVYCTCGKYMKNELKEEK